MGLRAEHGDTAFLDQHNSEEEEVFFALIKRMLKEKPKGWFAEIAKNIKGVSEETTTGVHRLYDMEKAGKLLFPAINVNDTRHQVEVRQPLWLPRIAGRRHPPRHRRDDVGQGRDGRGLRRRRQGLGRLAAPGRLPRDGVRSRSDLRAAGGDGRLRGHDHGRRRAARRHLRHRHRQQGHHHHRAHARDEGPRHRLQHRPLRQRDPDRASEEPEVEQHQAAGRRDRVSRQARASSCCRKAGW